MKMVPHILKLLFIIGYCAFSQSPANDAFANATVITHTSNWCSANAAYTTLNASADGSKGSAWTNGPNYNVWFKFQATTTEVNAQISIGGALGTMRHPFLALWDNSGTEITSSIYYSSTSAINVQSNNLTIGNWYYISVDNYVGTSYRGTFTLCVDNKVNNDFKERATEVPHTSNWCSAEAAYTTINASADGTKGSAWTNGPNYNVWFKFQATTTEVNAEISMGSTLGTMRHPFLALWNSAGTEITSSVYYTSTSAINVQSNNLTIGDWYYISVDNYVGASYRGTFTLCVDNKVNNDFKEKATEVPHTSNWCSGDAAYTTINASPDGTKGSAWTNGPNYNVWFKFQATTTEVNAQLSMGSSLGTLRYAFLALWDSAGTEITSSTYYSSTSTINVQSNNLTIGNWYYISVDNYIGTSYRGTFTLCVDDKVNNDFKEKATEVPHTSNWCSEDAEYTTINASPDGIKGSKWHNGPNYNVWFKFKATSSQVNAKISMGGTKGTMYYPYLALWNENGTEISSAVYATSTGSINVQSAGLTIGNWYYISVDNYSSTSYRGTFSLCIDDKVDYDFYEGAIDVTSFINSCSPDAIYTTIGASPDLKKGTTWNNNGPQLNRWFKFTAPESGKISVTVDIGGTKGTQTTTQVALWQADGITEVTSKRYAFNAEDVIMGAKGLTPGATYYISVDSYNSGYDGTFTLCLQDQLDYDFYEGAIDVTEFINSCSPDAIYTTVGASPDRNKGTAWNNNGPQVNRWFKFIANETGSINITVDIGGAKGSQTTTQVALWKADGVTEVASKKYAFNSEDVIMGAHGLVPEATYYISVDAYNSSYYGTFTLCLQDQLNYDFYEGAIDVTEMINSCSADAIYTTIGATPDRNKGSNWNNNGPQLNRWFRFVAPTTGQIEITVDIGGVKGTQTTTQIALWQADGLTEINSVRYVANSDDVILGASALTPGFNYYISVDALNTSYDGTFTLCLKDKVSYDFYEGAIDVTSLIYSCTSDAQYTTVGATPDKNIGSNWNNSGPKYNRWFKFTAPQTGQINVTVDVGGTKGSQQRTQLALWKDGGIVEVNSSRYVSNADDVVLSGVGLTPGAIYYISVDSFVGYTGTFTLCLENAFVDFNGSNYYVDYGNNHNFTSAFSLEAWVLQKSNASIATVISKGDVKSGANRGYHLTIKNGYPNLTWYNNSGTAIVNITSPYQITNNIWHHIATIYSGSKAFLYLDGVLVASSNSTSPLSNTFSFMLGAGYDSSTPTAPKNYFNGYIDEVRVWNVALTELQLREMMNQEIMQNGTAVKGKVIPSNISSNLLWASLKGYYPMTDNTAVDCSSNKINGYSKNNKSSIQPQTAPLPFITTSSSDWEHANAWVNNSVQYIPNSTLYGTQIDWNIVRISNNITINRSLKTLGLFIDADKTLTVNGDNELYNSWYLELNGTIDLMNDSQLVQTNTSNLVTSAAGKLLRRQEGTSNVFRYNYWSSPVGIKGATSLTDNNTSTNNTNNSAFTLNMLKDETGFNMNFTSAYNQLGKISTYWLYSFKNGVTYWDWTQLKANSALEPGIGYTQKGTGNAGLQQQYIFEGKPNNGTIVVNVTDKGGPGSVSNVSKTECLLGNPYPSALDIQKFIDDNAGIIEGTLQLWQQWAGDSHFLDEYKGGYARVNKLGAVRASQFVGIYGATTGSNEGTMPPSKYLPVGQGFIVEAIASGSVVFKNSQRVFIKEADADGTYNNGSTFFKSVTKQSKSTSETSYETSSDTSDVMQKLRLEFNSVSGPSTRREVLLGFSELTTDGYDYGYDSENFDVANNDFNLSLNGKNMNMLAYSAITDDKVIPLNFTSSANNTFEIKLTEQEQIDSNQSIYLRDNTTGTYFDLKQNTAYSFSSAAGKFNKRFEIVFQPEAKVLSTEEIQTDQNFVYYQHATKTLFGKKFNMEIDKLSLVDMRGQIIMELNNVSGETMSNGIKINNISTGTYIVWIRTQSSQVVTKKIVIN